MIYDTITTNMVEERYVVSLSLGARTFYVKEPGFDEAGNQMAESYTEKWDQAFRYENLGAAKSLKEELEKLFPFMVIMVAAVHITTNVQMDIMDLEKVKANTGHTDKQK